VAKRNGTKIYSEPSKKSSVVTSLKKNSSVEEKGRKGMYWQVKTQEGKDGFVSVLAVKFKPKGDKGAFSSAIRDAVRQGRDADDSSNVRSRSAVMGVRGLDESNDMAFAGNAKPNPRLIFQMENFIVDQKEVEKLGRLVEKEVESRLKRKGG